MVKWPTALSQGVSMAVQDTAVGSGSVQFTPGFGHV